MLQQILAPLVDYLDPGGAGVELGVNTAHYGRKLAALEGFARPLWGLAPLLAGGGSSPLAPLWLDGLRHGSDPAHPEYWGDPHDYSQALVEMPAIAFALTLAPEHFWNPLKQEERFNLAVWLGRINNRALVDNNWLSFRAVVNAALRRLGQPHDRAVEDAALLRLQEFHLGEGWFSDGEITSQQCQVDYYVPFAFHFYGLVYAALSGTPYGEHEGLIREQARAFASQFREWFARSGAALPFGRSLTYRFAQGSFWGAAAFAGEEILPWGELKGLWFQHLRWWLTQPIFSSNGLLTTGYAYPSLNISEQYNSPASPYWALKFFLPLALPEEHPFWQAEEVQLDATTGITAQPQPGFLVCREDRDDHIFALSGRQHRAWLRHGSEKYSKFAYSTHFGFNVPGGAVGEEHAAPDSTLLISDDGQHWRGREGESKCEVREDELMLRWQPFPDVTIETRLVPQLPGYLRLHRITTARPLHTIEGGWALGADNEFHEEHLGAADLLLSCEHGYSRIADLNGERQATSLKPDPNTNVLYPRTVIPVLRTILPPGRHQLICFVMGQRQEEGIRRRAPPFDLPDWPSPSLQGGVS